MPSNNPPSRYPTGDRRYWPYNPVRMRPSHEPDEGAWSRLTERFHAATQAYRREHRDLLLADARSTEAGANHRNDNVQNDTTAAPSENRFVIVPRATEYPQSRRPRGESLNRPGTSPGNLHTFEPSWSNVGRANSVRSTAIAREAQVHAGLGLSPSRNSRVRPSSLAYALPDVSGTSLGETSGNARDNPDVGNRRWTPPPEPHFSRLLSQADAALSRRNGTSRNETSSNASARGPSHVNEASHESPESHPSESLGADDEIFRGVRDRSTQLARIDSDVNLYTRRIRLSGAESSHRGVEVTVRERSPSPPSDSPETQGSRVQQSTSGYRPSPLRNTYSPELYGSSPAPDLPMTHPGVPTNSDGLHSPGQMSNLQHTSIDPQHLSSALQHRPSVTQYSSSTQHTVISPLEVPVIPYSPLSPSYWVLPPFEDPGPVLHEPSPHHTPLRPAHPSNTLPDNADDSADGSRPLPNPRSIAGATWRGRRASERPAPTLQLGSTPPPLSSSSSRAPSQSEEPATPSNRDSATLRSNFDGLINELSSLVSDLSSRVEGGMPNSHRRLTDLQQQHRQLGVSIERMQSIVDGVMPHLSELERTSRSASGGSRPASATRPSSALESHGRYSFWHPAVGADAASANSGTTTQPSSHTTGRPEPTIQGTAQRDQQTYHAYVMSAAAAARNARTQDANTRDRPAPPRNVRRGGRGGGPTFPGRASRESNIRNSGPFRDRDGFRDYSARNYAMPLRPRPPPSALHLPPPVNGFNGPRPLMYGEDPVLLAPDVSSQSGRAPTNAALHRYDENTHFFYTDEMNIRYGRPFRSAGMNPMTFAIAASRQDTVSTSRRSEPPDSGLAVPLTRSKPELKEEIINTANGTQYINFDPNLAKIGILGGQCPERKSAEQDDSALQAPKWPEWPFPSMRRSISNPELHLTPHGAGWSDGTTIDSGKKAPKLKKEAQMDTHHDGTIANLELRAIRVQEWKWELEQMQRAEVLKAARQRRRGRDSGN